MDPAAADLFEDRKDLDFYDFEPLPTLPEDEVSPRPKVGPPPSPVQRCAESFRGGCFGHHHPPPPGDRSWPRGVPPALNFPLGGTGPRARRAGQ